MRGSRGCVVVRNEVINKLTPFIELKKTPIVVTDKVTFISPTDVRQTSQRLRTWVDGWRQKWQQKQLKEYMAHYTDNFQGQGMNRRQWQRHKEGLNGKYEFIQVQVKEPVIYKQKDDWVVRFIQEYSSDRLSDFGEKILYLNEKEDGQWRIVGE